jgi:hypothetical protein
MYAIGQICGIIQPNTLPKGVLTAEDQGRNFRGVFSGFFAVDFLPPAENLTRQKGLASTAGFTGK